MSNLGQFPVVPVGTAVFFFSIFLSQSRATETVDKAPKIIIVDAMTKIPYPGAARRIKGFVEKLPPGYKAKVRFQDFYDTGNKRLITFADVLTPLNPAGKPDGEELRFADWYRPPVHTIQYKNGIRDGIEREFRLDTVWDPDAKRAVGRRYIYAEIPWQEGVVNGVRKTFYSNGQVASETNIVRGVTSGESCSYSEDGKIVRRARYRKGKRHGDMIDYWPQNGKVRRLVPYKKGKVHGVAREYYLSGNLKWQRPFKNNKLHGIEIHKKEDGTVERTRYWIKGVEVSKERFGAK